MFDRLHIDGAGVTQIGVFECCHQIDGTPYPTTISNCAIDNTIYGSVWVGTGRAAANQLRVTSCTLGAKPYYFQAGTAGANSIEVTTPTQHFRLTSTSSGSGSTFSPAWNAWSTPLS